VTPGNPTGVVLPPEEIEAFARLARKHGVALILDETYRSFRGTTASAHQLFADSAWLDTVVSLHSFSKDLALPGYRVGAVIGSVELNQEVAKILDCVAVCAPRIGQEAAWAGLIHAKEWRVARSSEIGERRSLFSRAMAPRPGGFELLSCGGFFGWVRHPFHDRSTDHVVRDLALFMDTVVMSGTAFLPDDRRCMRVSVGNCDDSALVDLVQRLEVYSRDYA